MDDNVDLTVDLARQIRQIAKELLKIARKLEKQAQLKSERTKDNVEVNKLAKFSEYISGYDSELAALSRIISKADQANKNTETSQLVLPRDKYQTCHIRLPGSDKRYPAVLVGQDYFSLVRVFSDIRRTLAAKAQLEWNGARAVITQAGKGYALWVWEPEATSSRRPDSQTPASPDEDVNQQENQQDSQQDKFCLLRVLKSPSQAQGSLTQYLLLFNRLSEWAHFYLGTAVIVHYWKYTRPDLAWLGQFFEVVNSGQVICRDKEQLSLNTWQEKQLQLWLQRFIQRCRRVIPNFPEAFLSEYKSVQLLINLLDYPGQRD